MSLFVIPAADIDAAGRSIDADLAVEWLDKQLAECDAKAHQLGHLAVRLSRSGNEIVVRGRVRAAVEVPCGRCLAPAKLNIDAELGLLLQPARPAPPEPGTTKAGKKRKGAAAATPATDAIAPVKAAGKKRAPKEKDLPEYEFSSGEADADTYDGETVVLDDFVREAILLEIPIFPLCSEACPGIAPGSSDKVDDGDLPRVDPRLAPLGALRAALAQPKAEKNESKDDSGAPPRSADESHRKKTK
jgi:uncharacterized protein